MSPDTPTPDTPTHQPGEICTCGLGGCWWNHHGPDDLPDPTSGSGPRWTVDESEGEPLIEYVTDDGYSRVIRPHDFRIPPLDKCRCREAHAALVAAVRASEQVPQLRADAALLAKARGVAQQIKARAKGSFPADSSLVWDLLDLLTGETDGE